jgi:hypothetical protein
MEHVDAVQERNEQPAPGRSVSALRSRGRLATIMRGSGTPARISAGRIPNSPTSAGASNAPTPSDPSLSDSITPTVRLTVGASSRR